MTAPFSIASPDSDQAIRDWLTQLAETAIAAVHPAQLLPANLPEKPAGRTVVVGAGKAAAAMASALEQAFVARAEQDGDAVDLEGVVVTRYQHGAECRYIDVLEASHPMPDALGEKAARQMLDAVDGLTAEDQVIALVSGGGSALMTLPAGDITLAEKQALNKALLSCGAPISQINTVRRHLSAVKGGRLAARAHPAPVVTYLISDVPGDEASLIASGPTLPDTTTPADALRILERHGMDIASSVRRHLSGDHAAPKAGDAGFSRDSWHMLARGRDALNAAEQSATRAGIDVRVLGDDLEGEARGLGVAQARLALKLQGEITRPLLVLSGGETSVRVHGDGRGGRNVEYLLGLFDTLKGAPGIHALAVDTDGIDGVEDNAGAVVGPECWRRAEALSLSAADYLARNDAYSFFAALENLVVTGPTRTNVNDFRAILVLPRSV